MDKFTVSMISGKRYTFYEKRDKDIIIFEAEFIDIIKGLYDTIRVCKYQYIDEKDYRQMNIGMLTMPADWIVRVKDNNDLLKQISLII